jgi:DNA polymerase-3 subunit delta
MQFPLQQLPQHLKAGKLLPVYLIHGDTLLLRQEARDAVRQKAQQQNFLQYQRFTTGLGFRWNELIQAANSYDLFAEKTLIEVHNPSTQFDAEAGKILLSYCEAPAEDKILLIVCGKLSTAQQKTRWYKAIQDLGAVVLIFPIKVQELPQWIHQRLREAHLQADNAAVRLLAEFTEGNLLATQQAIIKLRLLYPQQMIGEKEMAEVISDCAQFNIFELSQYILQGDARSVLRVMHSLRASDAEPTLVLWLLARECRALLLMAEKLQQGQNLQNVLSGQWASLKSLYQMALKRLSSAQLKNILLSCHQTDRIIKGAAPGNVWDALIHNGLALAGNRSLCGSAFAAGVL